MKTLKERWKDAINDWRWWALLSVILTFIALNGQICIWLLGD